jgi:hypothetical protein
MLKLEEGDFRVDRIWQGGGCSEVGCEHCCEESILEKDQNTRPESLEPRFHLTITSCAEAF